MTITLDKSIQCFLSPPFPLPGRSPTSNSLFSASLLRTATCLPINRAPSSRQRIPDLAGARSGRDRPGKLERTARRPGGSPFLGATCLAALAGSQAVGLLPAARYCLSGARERVADIVGAGGGCDAACQVKSAPDYAWDVLRGVLDGT